MQSTSGSNQSRQQQPQLEQPSQQQQQQWLQYQQQMMGSMGQYSSAAMEIEQHTQETNFSYFVNQPPMRRQHHPPPPPQYQPSPSQNQPPPPEYHRPLPQYNPPLPQYHIPSLPPQYQPSPSQNQPPPSQYHRPLPQYNHPLPQYHPLPPHNQAPPQQMFCQNKPGPAATAEKAGIKTIYVGRLQDWMDEPYLYSCFASAGEVANVKIIRHTNTGQSKGYGFVEFVSRATAENVLLFYYGSTMPGTEKQPYLIHWARYGTTFDRSDNLRLRVPDLAPRVTYVELLKMFANYQSVISAEVDYISGGSRGYGYVWFSDANERRRAMAEVYGKYGLRTPMQLVVTPMQSAGNAHQHQQLYPF